MKKIEDYLHLYLDREVICNYNGKGFRKKGLLIGKTVANQWNVFHKGYFPIHTYNSDNIKLLLRPLSDMTKDEEKEMIATQDKLEFKGYNFLVDSGETFRYMLSKGFDLFGLIEAGLAIDKTKL